MIGYDDGASGVFGFAEAGSGEPRANLEWVSNIRWAAIIGQCATLVTVRAFMHIALPLAPLSSIIAVEVALNLALRSWLRSLPLPNVPQWAISTSIGVDVLSFTALLYFTSGPFNPFFVLYLVHIALAMLVLRTASAWRVAALAFLCLGALFTQHRWLGVGWDPHAFGNVKAVVLHSQGTWAAFTVAAAFIVYFACKMRFDLSAREQVIVEARIAAARNEWLSSLTAVTAGAAHDLIGPLSTIAVAAHELERRLGPAGATLSYADAKLIREQVERCRAVLAQMARDAATPFREGCADITAGALLDRLREELSDDGDFSIDIDPVASRRIMRVPIRMTLQAIRNLVRNGWQAMPSGGKVMIRAAAAETALQIQIEDSGSGMDERTRVRAVDPLFTTKATSEGIGLGLFLTRVVLERVGGSIELQSVLGHGTLAVMQLPLLADANNATQPPTASSTCAVSS